MSQDYPLDISQHPATEQQSSVVLFWVTKVHLVLNFHLSLKPISI